jgi:hypothetical protein
VEGPVQPLSQVVLGLPHFGRYSSITAKFRPGSILKIERKKSIAALYVCCNFLTNFSFDSFEKVMNGLYDAIVASRIESIPQDQTLRFASLDWFGQILSIELCV